MPRRKDLSIRVTIRQKDGKTYLRHRDTVTGREQLRPVRGKYQSEWEREAGAWQRELTAAHEKLASDKRANTPVVRDLSWRKFRSRFSDEHLLSLADKTAKSYESALDCIERFFPDFNEDLDSQSSTGGGSGIGIPESFHVSQVTAPVISKAASGLRLTGISESTIDNYLRHLKAALNWAFDIDLLEVAPKFPRVHRARKGRKNKPMKGRPPTDAEFELMLNHVAKIVHASEVAEWQRLITDLWWSGLRLGEAIDLWWDRTDKMRVDLSGNCAVLRIRDDSEKGGKDRVYPIAPEYAERLAAIPIDQRKGKVYPVRMPGRVARRPARNQNDPTANYASKIIVKIGESAGIVTHCDPVKGRTPAKNHYAGAHSLRRGFGTRWARRVFPQVLQQMMRHEDISTTMGYYVEIDAETLSADIYQGYHAFLEKNQPKDIGGVTGGVEEICPHCGQRIPHKNQ